MPTRDALAQLKLRLAESGRLPDGLVRWGIRGILERKLAELARSGPAARDAFVAELRRSPVALVPDQANAQHYEWPPAFFEAVLGPRLKYSCAWFPPGVDDLAEAEEAMLALTCERAALEDGMTVLDLGCGWGSLALWIAERYPRCRVLAVSNSKAQREFVVGRASGLGLGNLEVRTADMNAFESERRFDRVVSVEMFEHMRNWEALLQRISHWLEPEGRLFLHFFAHRTWAYPYESDGADDWMGRHFFTGGMMPSADLLDHFSEHLEVEAHWEVSGVHYQRTCQAWLRRQDAAHKALAPILEAAVGAREASVAFQRWRLFFLACAELFASGGGEEWRVCHRRLRPRAQDDPGGERPTGRC